MQASKIEWTDRTWNPVTGCTKVSQGCKNCYAEKMHERFNGKGSFRNVQERPERLHQPLKWKTPSKIFVNSMSDLFHEDVSFDFLYDVFLVMKKAKHHTFQILTKRPDIALKFFNHYAYINYELPNVWLGVSVEDQKTADERIPILLHLPATVRFLSCEPLLEKINISTIRIYLPLEGSVMFHRRKLIGSKIDWVICGGESGHAARPMHPDWVRTLRDQCKATNVPFFFKQWGEYMPFEATPQPPFFRSQTAIMHEYDGHTMNVIDPHTWEAGKFLGCRWFDQMSAVTLCVETDSDNCSFLRMGKSKTSNYLDGIQHLEFPKL
jgi:protein gp37